MSGKEIHSFDDAGEHVTVVLGDFRLMVGRRVVSGRDAVVWIRTSTIGRIERNEITVYVSGEAKVVEPDGSTTTDRTMLVKVYHQGRLSASGRVSRRSLTDFPLYRTALAVRGGEAARPKAAARPADRAGPELIRTTTAPARRPGAPGKPRKPRKPVEPWIYQPVTLRADRFTSREIGRGADRRRATVARGNVYLSQGHPDSDEFLELRSQVAVVFSVPKAARAAPGPPGGEKPAPAGAMVGRETIVGVYLEGDVIIARGERYFRGPKAYYDFTTHRSVMPNAVFRTIQEQRDIPLYIRAEEARTLSDREMWFKNAKVSTSDFYSPTYHISASRAYVKDITIYEEAVDPKTGRVTRGVKLSERGYSARMLNTTFNVRSVPVLYWPWVQGNLTDGNSPLRTAQIGSDGDLGFGVNTEWHMFRLLGLVAPDGFKGRADLGFYKHGTAGGLNLEYLRDNFSGYAAAYGIVGGRGEDDFGDERENISAPKDRSRVTWRHKHFLEDDWQLQFEFSWQSDRNFLESYFPGEFRAGKEQETLLYAKKQRDNWVFDVLVQVRVNSFMTQTESWPDLGFAVIGQPLGETQMVWFSEQHAGLKRWRPDSGTVTATRKDSDVMTRLDTRQEVNLPLHVGPVNILPYVTGRASYWSDSIPVDGEHDRGYGQVGVRASTRMWRLYPNVESRLWDVHGIRHVLTPEATAFLAGASAEPRELWPMNADIEQRVSSLDGVSVALTQRLQTKRGPADNRRVIDWMRFRIDLGFFGDEYEDLPADGRTFAYRPEHSVGRDHLNFDYEWNISEGTTLLADANYDLNSGELGRAAVGLTVRRTPRFKYYVGLRTIDALDTRVFAGGVTYKISDKYTLSFFEQYDFDFNGGTNVSTSISLVRKLPRWYAGFSIIWDQTDDDIGVFVTFWPEGIPEFRLTPGRLTLLGSSDKN